MTHSALHLTQPYPFARLRELLAGARPAAHLEPISLGMGEPQHPTPRCITEALTASLSGLSHYPATQGSEALRESITGWCARRYGVQLDSRTQVLPVLGSREALFSFVQSHIDPHESAFVVCPSPFYQIYEGAALLAGAQPLYLPLTEKNGYRMNFELLSTAQLTRTRLVFVCSPNNPTGATLDLAQWKHLFELSDTYGFAIASDECYSEIYPDEGRPPLGALTAAAQLGRTDFRNIIVFQSLSKRSSAPGLRSGFVAGDARLLAPFLLYRTYHGSAMSPVTQAASVAAWNDEQHVRENRRLYREKFAAAQPLISSVLRAPMPEASFYLWVQVPGDDQLFTRSLYEATAVTVLPGTFLSRESFGINPGYGFVRLALVAAPEQAAQAAARIQSFMKTGGLSCSPSSL